AGIFILVGNFLLHTSLQVLIFTLITLIYLIVGTILEEKKLVNEFGDAYRDYQKKVKMLIPYIF
ncbi:MAG: protein-S-isoprenylcysteine methyltransferase, partial [Bacteroidetes bacterium]|nr:protein-S-isoprenylcysteine methyltransferase [Bacteroidota bacterium]